MSSIFLTGSLSLALLARDAAACGGFACDLGPSGPPILQSAERIVFGLDSEQGEVEMHVQIDYDGADDNFAWIVPVPGPPDLFLTTAMLFDQVQTATAPTFTRSVVLDGNCTPFRLGGANRSESAATDAPIDNYSVDTSSYDVTVVAKELVGPYETITLRAASSEDLIGFLQQEGYALPDRFEEILSPYLSSDAYFVALKLAAGSVGGSLAPLALRFQADKAMVPVQLTSISAVPDMRMETYLFSDGRAVPESYLHVQLNDAAFDWWNAGVNYLDVISRAADEAGGHAFATDYHGDSDIVPVLFSGFSEGSLRSEPDPVRWVTQLRQRLTPVSPELFPTLEQIFALQPGEGAQMWDCPACVFHAGTFDPQQATEILLERVVEPLQAAQMLLDRFPKLSRMTSSMDAVEMTVDPVFVVNRDLATPDVDNDHVMVETVKCRGLFGQDPLEADREIALPDGRVIEIPSVSWLLARGMTELQYLSEHAEQSAVVIEQMGAAGEPVILVDHRGDLLALAQETLGCGGSGCDSTGRIGAGLGAAALLISALRRQRP